MLRRETKNLGDMLLLAEQSKTQKNKNSKPDNLTFYLDYGELRKEYLDSVTNFKIDTKGKRVVWTTIRKYYYRRTLIKVAQVTLKCNRLAVEFYLTGIVAGTNCNKIFSKRLGQKSQGPLVCII